MKNKAKSNNDNKLNRCRRFLKQNKEKNKLT